MSIKIQYSSYGNSIDGTNYCSGVETLAENLVEDNEEDAVITFPSKDGWASLRSTAYRMTTENAEAVLPLPIYKIKKVLVKVKSLGFSSSPTAEKISDADFLLSDFKNSQGQSLSEFDITDYVKTATEWKGLDIATIGRVGYTPNYCFGIYKDNTFYWDEGARSIAFLSTVYKKGEWSPADDTPTYERLLRTMFYRKGDEYKTNLYPISDMSTTFFYLIGDVREWQFRIEYVPVSTKTKIRARKAAKTREEYIQPFNQRAEINAVSAFGKNMYLTAQKTGVKELVLVKRYTSLADIPPLGTVIYQNGKMYRLVANNFKITNTIYAQVTHVYSENWSRKSQHVSVDQKYRNWKIPQDILWRNLYREDYLICSTTDKITPLVPSKLNVGLATRLFLCGDTSTDKTINSLCWFFTPTGETAVKGVTVPCSTYGTANSMVFSATFKDNLSAGLAMCEDQEDLCEEAFYCNADGTLDKATVILTSGLDYGFYNFETGFLTKEGLEEIGTSILSAVASVRYPMIVFINDAAANAPRDELYRDTYKLLKDSGEALKYTYQVHIVPDQADLGVLVIGEKFGELSPLVKEWEETRSLKLVLSKRPLREGERLVVGDAYMQAANGEYFYYSVDTDYARLTLSSNAWVLLANNSDYVAWAICDEKDRLLIGCNDVTKKVIYFSMTHKR